MSPMRYDENWVAPWNPGLPQARCVGRLCVADGLPGRLVVAMTLSAEGLCANCARTPANMYPDLDAQHDAPEPTPSVIDAGKVPQHPVQLELL